MANYFFLLGAMRAGTTSLHYYLSQHPDICVSEPKETHFFESEADKGLSYLENNYFPDRDGENLLGEAQPFNLFLPFVPKRIKQLAPDARLIVVLREPVSRCFSQWWLFRNVGWETLNFREALEAEVADVGMAATLESAEGPEAWKRHVAGRARRRPIYRTFLHQGHYADQVRRLRDLFSEDQLLILSYDSFRKDPAAITRRVWSHLGVDPGAELDLTIRVPSLGPLGGQLRRISRPVTGFIPLFAKKAVRDLLALAGDKPPRLSAEDRRWLEDYYRPYNADLARELGAGFAPWLEGLHNVSSE